MMKNDLKGKNLQSAILQDIESLPPMPRIVEKARQILEDPRSNLKDLATLIETDQALAIKVLRLSNSAYYSRINAASSIQEAAVVLGMKVLGELLTVACTSKLLGRSLKGYNLPAETMWCHSLSVAVGARLLAKRKHPDLANEAFSAGLVHDAGKLILDKYILDRQDAFASFLADGNETFLNAEKEILGFDHAEIAARVCQKWSFPKPIYAAIEYHHKPSRFRGSLLAFIVHAADQIAIWSGMDTDGISVETDHTSFDVLGIGFDEIEPMMNEIIQTVGDIIKQLES
jgi:HD-like signal output (HDOD) protein